MRGAWYAYVPFLDIKESRTQEYAPIQVLLQDDKGRGIFSALPSAHDKAATDKFRQKYNSKSHERQDAQGSQGRSQNCKEVRLRQKIY